MIRQLVASTLLAINIGIQNTTTDTTKYQNWQATNAVRQTINDDYVEYFRYIYPTTNYKNEIIEVRQNCLYLYTGGYSGHYASFNTNMYMITDVNPDTTIQGNYEISIEMTMNQSWYNLAYPQCDAYRQIYQIDYTDLNTTQKANLESLLLDKDWQMLNDNAYQTKRTQILEIKNLGTELENSSSVGNTIDTLRMTYQYNNYINDFDTGRKIYITMYQIDWTSLYTNIDPQSLNDIYDGLIFTPTASENYLQWEATAQTGEIVDIPGIMFTILGMPFAFVAQAFDLTVFPGTPYEVNLSHVFLAIAGAGILIFIIKKVIK